MTFLVNWLRCWWEGHVWEKNPVPNGVRICARCGKREDIEPES